ncbi:MAG: NAD(P)/FAD-dependent oxidoreductase [Bacteroidota bacterium]
MEKKSVKIYVVGAGISGLIAAKTLKENGYSPTLLEATDIPGGRVKTDAIDGVLYDHGFQVLLTAYPQAKKHLDYNALQLKKFKPGALVFNNGTKQRIGDPLRDISALLPTLSASIGSITDKFKIFKLTQQLKKKSIAEIFSSQEMNTLDYLKNFGFSDQILTNFFYPFFTGIFLEEKLKTSSRLFEFIFKMFAEGYAAVPQKGIGIIPEQLVGELKECEFRYNTKVTQVRSKSIILANGDVLSCDAAVVTVPLSHKTGNIDMGTISWKSCDNLYFTVDKRTFEEGIIGLVADKSTLINNIYYPFGQKAQDSAILSVTVVKAHKLNESDLVKTVRKELQSHCGITVNSFLKRYTIKQALPDMSELKMELTTDKTSFSESVFMAGDYILGGSLNAAMVSGEAAANALMASL